MVLVIFGGVFAGYFGGHYEARRVDASDTSKFLRDFARSTEQQTYLEQRGQKGWHDKLMVYGLVGASSPVRTANFHSAAVGAGITCLVIGLFGLMWVSKEC
ncbi:MAG: hypothetical protein JWO95_1493 [Verrucomicrobiales bacterium]|nr:hypothetical protein [Verrucomicrobiales bacterium]